MSVQIYTLHAVQLQDVKILLDLRTVEPAGKNTHCFIPDLFFCQDNMIHIRGYLLESKVYLINKNGVDVQIPYQGTIDVDSLYRIYANTYINPVSDVIADWCPQPYRPES